MKTTEKARLESKLEKLEARCKEIRLKLCKEQMNDYTKRYEKLSVTSIQLANKEIDRRHKDNEELAQRTWNLIKGKSDKKIIEEIADSIRHGAFRLRGDIITYIIKIHEERPNVYGTISDAVSAYGSPTAWALHLDACVPCRALREFWELKS